MTTVSAAERAPRPPDRLVQVFLGGVASPGCGRVSTLDLRRRPLEGGRCPLSLHGLVSAGVPSPREARHLPREGSDCLLGGRGRDLRGAAPPRRFGDAGGDLADFPAGVAHGDLGGDGVPPGAGGAATPAAQADAEFDEAGIGRTEVGREGGTQADGAVARLADGGLELTGGGPVTREAGLLERLELPHAFNLGTVVVGPGSGGG